MLAVKEIDIIENIQRYYQGWQNNNIQMIIDSVEEDVVIIESHGPTYHGVKDLKKWFALWLEANSRIIKFKISSFHFCEKEKTAFCEWDFQCRSSDQTYAFPGACIIKFSSHSKISMIHEYRMSKAPYKWDGSHLISD